MPGIAGIISRSRHPDVNQDLQTMVESMRHETYYAGNRYVNEEIGMHVGWLSHPHSLGETMPLVSHDKRTILIIVGEHFPRLRDLRSLDGGALGKDAEGLLDLYRHSPIKFLRYLNGWFAGIAIDLEGGEVTLFNDRYGMSRIYVHEDADEFLFASEAKSLLRIRPALREIDQEALAQYFRFNCVVGNKSLFKGISLLPGGSSWRFSRSSAPLKESYFDYAEWEQQPILEPAAFHRRFEETISRVFPAYFEEDQSVGLSLTAGMDTRVILAAIRERGRQLPSYTFGGPSGETFDIRTARRLADACNFRHQVIRINDDFFKDFPKYAEECVYRSDGTHDVLGAHDVYFNELTRTIAPIRLTGKFGSEVVRSRRLIPSENFVEGVLQPRILQSLAELPSIDHYSRRDHPLSRVVADEIAWYEFGRVAVEQSKVILRTPYMDNELVELMYQAPSWLRASRELQTGFLQERNHYLGDMPTNMGKLRTNGGLVGKLIYGLFWALAKEEYVYLSATPHWLTRVDRTLEKFRPERFAAGRQKFEFYRIWTKTRIAEFIRAVLLSPRAYCSDLFDKARMERAILRHTAGTHNYVREINKMLTIELIYSRLLRS